MASKWNKYDSAIKEVIANNPKMSYSLMAKKILKDEATYRDVDLLRTYIRRKFGKNVNTILQKEEELSNVFYNKDKNEQLSTTLENNNSSIKNEYEIFKERNGISEEDVASVKAWGKNPSGQGFSVVYKNGAGEEFNIEESFKNVLDSVKLFSLNLPTVSPNNKFVMMVHSSDKHVGAEVIDSMYENDYSCEIFRDRMVELAASVIDTVNMTGPVQKLILTDLGDSVDGYKKQTTRGGHTLPQNLSDKEQFEVFTQVHIEYYETLLSEGLASSYEIYHVTECNHAGDIGYIAARYVQQYFQFKYPQVKFKLLTNFLNNVIVGDHCFILTHGKDSQERKHGLPLYLNQDTENYLLQYVKKNKIPSKYIHCIKGDLHTFAETPGRHLRYKNIGSVFGSSRWSERNFGDSDPQATIEWFTPNERKIYTEQIYL